MYICVECGRIFEDPMQWEEKHSLDSPPYEKFYGCPYCHGSYTEAYKCECCDEWIDDDYVKTDDDKRYCFNCVCKMRLGDE